ncbi:ABC transporter permease [Cellulomonas marina]|uniref:NitT/TauT family transport system permease protein n=1 Tax=Cellulomonas marina TaxID=988821 RepID=A0A1I0XP06_9CELL|nr:ABC transporter permease [Cellulomonas marina]GIG30064.1 sulfate ABC transporter permease [Cellulomonas marina]SFB02702.1 NitT/TauT family transport system permease protein [Cellulomonas marina]
MAAEAQVRSSGDRTEDHTGDRTGTRALEAGLDALETAAPRAPGARATARSLLPPVVVLLGLLAVWQVAVSLELKPRYILPAPTEVAGTVAELVTTGRVWDILWTSVSRGVLGFVVAVLVGTVLGIVLSRSRLLRAGFGPLISGLQSLPSVAWVPAAIIWFGLTDDAIYAVILLGAVPSVINGLLSGLDQVPPLFDKVGRVLGLSAPDRVRHVLLPAALPGYLAGLKQGWAFSWRSLMAAELIAASPQLGIGLGQYLDQARQLHQMDGVFVGILLILLVGVAVDLLVFSPLERRVLHQRGLTGTKG